ncbi:hypothetical protein [Gilvibacter sediminis]|uniref:hypothetical protein n=1 Tax=Gilvibacter sediminis TaxID=379071 RepID=UPI002350747B|nr:hypothetical protein [Gilvibacter sediminis]MDC7998011.1 hypothetical protein [Gilvibacter sediminis]
MKYLFTLLLMVTINLSFGQSDSDFLIIGDADTEGCIGVSKPAFIKNVYTSVNVKVTYKRLETDRVDLERMTNILSPGQQVKIGCEVNEGGFERRFQVIDVKVLGGNSDDNKRQILDGTPFKVTLNGTNCPSDDGWTGSGDPLGTLLCGKVYKGFYSNGKYTITGYHERTRREETHTYGNANPSTYGISLWGVFMTYTEEGQVIHPVYGVVGTLSFN